MMERKKKLRITQISLFLLGLIIIFLTYTVGQKSTNKEEILNKQTKDQLQQKINKDDDGSNVFYNISYSGLDLSGNRYILKSEVASTSKNNDEIIDMKGVEAVFYFKDDTVLYIWSDLGQYNNKTLDMNFRKNVKANYDKTQIFADKVDYSNFKGSLIVSENVVVKDIQGSLDADKLLFDIKTQTLDIASFKNDKINAKVKINEKRF